MITHTGQEILEVSNFPRMDDFLADYGGLTWSILGKYTE